MSHIFDTEFIPISITIFQRISGALPFDVFIKRANNVYTKVFPKGEVIDANRLKSYQFDKGVESLHVTQKDYRQYLFYVERVADNLFYKSPAGASSDELADVVSEMANLTMLEIIVQMNVDQEAVSHATTTVKGCVAVLGKDPKSLAKIMKMLTRHPYSMRHSLSTSIFSILLAKAENLTSEKTLLLTGLGGLLHDVGMSQVSFDAEDKTELTPQEWKEIKEHPALGKRMLDTIKSVPPEVRSIALQHHEQPNGRGYPNGMHEKDIYFLSKIVAIADSFSALVSKRPYREEACTAAKAIELMMEDRGKFDTKLLADFAKLFISVK